MNIKTSNKRIIRVSDFTIERNGEIYHGIYSDGNEWNAKSFSLQWRGKCPNLSGDEIREISNSILKTLEI